MRLVRQTFVALFLCTISVSACTSSRPGRPSADPNVISRDQILAGSYPTAYDAVRSLHPNWLVRRSQRRANDGAIIWVYVDNNKYGDVNTLRNVLSASVNNIRRIDGGTATTRWGVGHSEGVLAVTTFTPPR